MKKILILLLGTLSIVPVALSKPKCLKNAEKLIGNAAEIVQARKYISEAMADTLLERQAYTHYLAGKIEKELYRHYYKKLSINRNDPSVDHTAMADALINAYREFVTTMSLDTLTDKKGRKKTTYSPEIAEWITKSAPAIYNAGIAYMNKKLYFPKGYEAFMIYADLPDKSFFIPSTPMSDSVRATAYFYGGVMAYNAAKHREAASAFRRAREFGYKRTEVFLNEMSSLSHLAQDNPTDIDSLSASVTKLAHRGFMLYGNTNPLFLQKYVAGMLIEHKPDSALSAIDIAIKDDKGSLSDLHAMKASVMASMGRNIDAVDEYKTAASDTLAQFNTLQMAAQHIAMVGIAQLGETQGRGKEARRKTKEIKESYLRPALEYALRAKAIKNDDPIVANTIETVTYYLH